MTATASQLLAEQIELACLLEATARKPGNVHPAASFHDLNYTDFVKAAAACAGPLSHTATSGAGPAIRQAVRATKTVCRSNVNLGICLLLAPIAAVSDATLLEVQLPALVAATTVADAEAVYTAIRMATAGGLGQVKQHDVSAAPTITLLAAMQLAADRDAIAAEWASGFAGLRGELTAGLVEEWEQARQRIDGLVINGMNVPPWELAILQTQLRFLTRGDTLIARKCGRELSEAAAAQARAIIEAGGWYTPQGREHISRFDVWLRADGHRRNPGTTADLLAACLLYAIRKGWITPPSRSEILHHSEHIVSASSLKS